MNSSSGGHRSRSSRSHSLDSQKISSQLQWLWKKLGTNSSSSSSSSSSSGALLRRHSIDPTVPPVGPTIGRNHPGDHQNSNIEG
ncbi:hypothetical protein HNY73_002309 [Argiope bruennichi]|uniref:Uncharacterized protein n=1 Tax=Argiope bruennichi TaxID=94029 RepID=A0A8T0FVS3_ARGBR|nr:hypothetical protein HNY73_002309 [Argiope bruennichi]